MPRTSRSKIKSISPSSSSSSSSSSSNKSHHQASSSNQSSNQFGANSGGGGGRIPESSALSNIRFSVYDNCCFLLYCLEHRRVLLTGSSAARFLPHTPLGPFKTWRDTSFSEALNFVFGGAGPLTTETLEHYRANSPFRCFAMCNLFRFQLPQSQRFVTRLTYLVEIGKSSLGSADCPCHASCHPALRWFDLNDAARSNLSQVWGPEVSYFSNVVLRNETVTNPLVEFSLNDAFKYMLMQNDRNSTTATSTTTLTTPSNPLSSGILSIPSSTAIRSTCTAARPAATTISSDERQLCALLVNLTIHDIERLYADFVEHCFPSFYLSRHSFEIYMQRHEIEFSLKTIARYYVAFRIRGKHYLRFNELLLGLAAIDSRTPHSIARIKFVFRFYDHDRDGTLNFDEFRRLLTHLAAPSRPPSDATVAAEIRKVAPNFGESKDFVGISFEQFRRAVVSHTLRGTSRLCRVAVMPFAQITRSLAARKLCKTVRDHTNLKKILINRRYGKKCGECVARSPPYRLSALVVTLAADGTWRSSEPVTGVIASPATQQSSASSSPTASLSTYSVEVTFNRSSALHYLLKQIRHFCAKEKGTPKNFRGLFAATSAPQLAIFLEDVRKIAADVARLVEAEQRVLPLADPTYIIGDIHGNLEDLLSLERTLWRRIPLLTVNYLFLGDFVDRGKWGFECFLYLMCLKLLCPQRIHLLRGNHEIRAIQCKYSFQKELIAKYGTRHAQSLFDAYNHVFDRLPFAAIVSNSIYAAHGGIPRANISLSAINAATPHVLPNPEVDAIAVWEILWSDPLDFAKFEETATALGVKISYGTGGNGGNASPSSPSSPSSSSSPSSCMYLHNAKRGTAYVFNEFALYAFLRANALQFVIRAHEVPADGFKFNFGTLCTTIFSCSHYCGNENECAVLLVERESRLRLLRIDTGNNRPAMGDV